MGINRWGRSSQFDSGKRIPNKWDPFLHQLQLFISFLKNKKSFDVTTLNYSFDNCNNH